MSTGYTEGSFSDGGNAVPARDDCPNMALCLEYTSAACAAEAAARAELERLRAIVRDLAAVHIRQMDPCTAHVRAIGFHIEDPSVRPTGRAPLPTGVKRINIT